jgi:hypothetical protein
LRVFKKCSLISINFGLTTGDFYVNFYHLF